jgi:CheY-like chemotaxis protein
MAIQSVLLIDDDPGLAALARMALESHGYTVHWEDGGVRGLEAARRLRPDLILLDLQMPDLPGVEVLRALKDDPETAAIPVVICSGQTSILGSTERAVVVGVLDKPFRLAELYAAINRATA